MRLVAKMNLDSAAIAAPQTIIKSATVFIVVPSDEYSIELRGVCQALIVEIFSQFLLTSFPILDVDKSIILCDMATICWALRHRI